MLCHWYVSSTGLWGAWANCPMSLLPQRDYIASQRTTTFTDRTGLEPFAHHCPFAVCRTFERLQRRGAFSIRRCRLAATGCFDSIHGADVAHHHTRDGPDGGFRVALSPFECRRALRARLGPFNATRTRYLVGAAAHHHLSWRGRLGQHASA